MIGLVTWPPFTYVVVQKGGQVTKPIMHGCEIAILLNYCVCLLSKRIYNKQLHCMYPNFLALPDIRAFSRGFVHNAASSWPRNFFTP